MRGNGGIERVVFLQSDVEKFLASRMRDGKREFLVKHKHTSYWHLTWLPEPVLLEMSPHNKGRILRWVEANGEPDDRNLDAPETVRDRCDGAMRVPLIAH